MRSSGCSTTSMPGMGLLSRRHSRTGFDGARSNADVAVFVAQDDRAGCIGRGSANLPRSFRLLTMTKPTLSPEDDEVRRALIEGGDTAARILAEEWTFLQSQSWAVSSCATRSTRFANAGARRLWEFAASSGTNSFRWSCRNEVRLTSLRAAVVAKVAAKWVIVGGASAGGTFLGPVGAAAGLLPIPIVRAVDP